jgi:hypothetical protein
VRDELRPDTYRERKDFMLEPEQQNVLIEHAVFAFEEYVREGK